MLDVTFGATQKREWARRVVDVIQAMDLHGSLYIGYPLLATADENLSVDALLVSKEHGLIVIAFLDSVPNPTGAGSWSEVREKLDNLYVAVENTLRRHASLRIGRSLAVEPQIVGLFPVLDSALPAASDITYTDFRGLPDAIRKGLQFGALYHSPLESVLQRVSNLKPKKRRQKAVTPKSRGSILRDIEKEIANLDKLQKQAAIESPEGPQRIRGLAGSGKTIVLALKAAYLHTQYPDWSIAVTFQTRSLYQQFQDLILRFSFEHQNDEPDWSRLQVIHAWGGSGRGGVYSQIAQHVGLAPLTLSAAQQRFGWSNAFAGACGELLAATDGESVEPLFDAVLIDEAQDFPSEFFQLVYRFTRPPKRVIWAYDDLQKLSEATMPSLGELFGLDALGEPLVSLSNRPGSQQDIVLKVCYRNPPQTLTVAHALGLGAYRKEFVQYFDDHELWRDIGYAVKRGSLEPGQIVTLERSVASLPRYFADLLEPSDVVSMHRFVTPSDQATFIATAIADDLSAGELEFDDILVVLPTVLEAQRDAQPIADALAQFGIDSHIVGYKASPDRVFKPNSVAMAHIHRSKGNEAAMVYIAHADRCLDGSDLITLRNTLFTAVTRSRAWCRICGVGARMARLEEEVDKVVQAGFTLRFRVPTAEELAKMRTINRERSTDERARQKQAESAGRTLRDALVGGVEIDSLSPNLRDDLSRLFQQNFALDFGEE